LRGASLERRVLGVEAERLKEDLKAQKMRIVRGR
jgi:hypothetical protein